MTKVDKKAFDWKLSDHRGVSLLESMVALFVTVLSLLLLVMLTQNIQSLQERMRHDKHGEWHIFLHQLPKEVEGYQPVYARGSQIIFKNERGRSIHIRSHGSNVIRQVDYRGYQPLLTRVSSIHYELLDDHRVKVYAEFLTGEHYQAVVSFDSS